MAKLQNKIPYAVRQAQELDGIPYTTHGSKWIAGPCDGICWWTNGFWPGTMWQMYLMTGDEQYAAEAQRSELLLDTAFLDFDHLHHDVGFMWRLSAAAQYDLTGNRRSYDRAMQAATILAGRYNPLGFIRA
ncbi:MAG: glycosyl hydrolase family 88, partial [Lachnospiraceae bacterium]|nr:glycosyl hydrolase family 88 [Lachnospiraceae bacterium]